MNVTGHRNDWPTPCADGFRGDLSERCRVCSESMGGDVPPHPSGPSCPFFCIAIADVDQNLLDRLQRVNSTLSSQIGRLQNIRNTIEETGNLAEQARARVESTEQLIEIASRELEKAKVAVANVVSDGDAPRWGRERGWGHPLAVGRRSGGVLLQLDCLLVSFRLSKPGVGKPHCSSQSCSCYRELDKNPRALPLALFFLWR